MVGLKSAGPPLVQWPDDGPRINRQTCIDTGPFACIVTRLRLGVNGFVEQGSSASAGCLGCNVTAVWAFPRLRAGFAADYDQGLIIRPVELGLAVSLLRSGTDQPGGISDGDGDHFSFSRPEPTERSRAAAVGLDYFKLSACPMGG